MKQRAIIALADSPTVGQAIADAARSAGYDVKFAPPTDDVVGFLVAAQPIEIVADLDSAADWRAWILAAKTSPATRKIPCVAFGADDETRRRALDVGCDAALTAAEFMADPGAALEKFARPDDADELLRQAALPLPEAALEGVRQFNRGEFFEQHETFEYLWRAEAGPIRALYQGILQVGVAYLQIERQNYEGARKLFQRAWQYLNALPDVAQGVGVGQLRADARAAQAELERLGPGRIGEFDRALLKPIVLC